MTFHTSLYFYSIIALPVRRQLLRADVQLLRERRQVLVRQGRAPEGGLLRVLRSAEHLRMQRPLLLQRVPLPQQGPSARHHRQAPG